ncbi:uncharacterized protein GLRG_06587 [Colletotrichum graminicola M1.001]|uniref:Uncharacterized protein n=1 Tax=Colletotrichum graminicola (strain M1.001 / M2 / FGSC 10212) TaxID=645133 RepID=E3QKQ5_COLGM|nr:uncharacterized protein GLRG_06587 [Colletotrichum graminicola M1.001]EFQ31443.1 hypothetical protein GLRG_06587 [Colletotrichum graminicola M1.001]
MPGQALLPPCRITAEGQGLRYVFKAVPLKVLEEWICNLRPHDRLRLGWACPNEVLSIDLTGR